MFLNIFLTQILRDQNLEKQNFAVLVCFLWGYFSILH